MNRHFCDTHLFLNLFFPFRFSHIIFLSEYLFPFSSWKVEILNGLGPSFPDICYSFLHPLIFLFRAILCENSYQICIAKIRVCLKKFRVTIYHQPNFDFLKGNMKLLNQLRVIAPQWFTYYLASRSIISE